MDTSIYKIEKTETPSYLSELLFEKETITLIHLKSGPIKSTNGDEEPFTFKDVVLKDAFKEELDLTGNPLDTDLHEDSTSHFSILTAQPDNWTVEENKHFPMDKTEATILLNSLNLGKIKVGSTNTTFYCVCDGHDRNGVIMLGSSPRTFKSIMVCFNGCFKRNQNEMQLAYMIKQHLKNAATKKTKINSTCSHVYSIVGYNMKNCTNLDVSNILKSAIMKVSIDKPFYSILDEIAVNADLRLQVLPVHKDAILHSYWSQLELIQYYIDILPSEFIDTIELSQTPVDIDIADVVKLLTKSSNAYRQPISKKEKLDKVLNYNELRNEDFLDKLWSILTVCQTSSIVKDVLQLVFEEVANDTFINVKIPESSRTSIGDILNGILKGSTAVPTLTTINAVELLIELGIEKLKNDYLHIIEHYDQIQYSDILTNWSALMEQTNPKTKKSKTKTSMRMTVVNRKTRVPLDSELSDKLQKKLNYISNLHVACEFLDLIHSSNLPHQYLPHYTKSIFNQYASLNNIKSFKTIRNDKLSEININMQNIETTFLDKFKIIAWNLKMNSTVGHTSVTTIFHHSASPIIPPTIFDKYDIPVESIIDEEKIFYVMQYGSWQPIKKQK